MRDKDDRVRVVREKVLEPVAGLEVEMVGGLVQQQEVRLRQQKLGERDPHLPTSAEVLRGQVELVGFEAEAEQDFFSLAFDGEAAAAIPFVTTLAVAFDHLRVLGGVFLGVERRHLLFELFNLDADGEHLLEREQGLVAERFTAMVKSVLREVAHRRAPGHGDFAGIGGFFPGQHAQERRFAGAVRPGETDTVAVGHVPGDVLEQDALTVSFGNAVYL